MVQITNKYEFANQKLMFRNFGLFRFSQIFTFVNSKPIRYLYQRCNLGEKSIKNGRLRVLWE